MASWVQEDYENAEYEPDTTKKPEENEADTDGGKKGNAGVYFLHPDVKKVYPRGVESIPRTEQDTLERQQQQDTISNNKRADSDKTDTDKPDVVVALSSQGVSKRVAQKLAREYEADFIVEKIASLDFLLSERPDELKRPAAWLRKAIEDDYTAPDGFVSVDERERQASEEKRRIQADSEALRRQQEHIEAQERTRDEERAAKRAEIHERYGTKPEDEEFWQAVLKELRYGVGLANFALIADAEILQVTDDTAMVGVTSEAKYRDLQHPGQQKQIQRALKQVADRDMAIEFVYLNSDGGS